MANRQKAAIRVLGGTVVTGEWEAYGIPDVIRSKYGNLKLHGAGSSGGDMFTGVNWAAAVILAAKSVREGIPFAACRMGGDLLGNDTNLGYVTALGNQLDSIVAGSGLPGASGYLGGKWHLDGVSQGGFVGARYAILNSSKVKSFQGYIPCCSIIDIHDTNRGNADFTGVASNAWSSPFATGVSMTFTAGSKTVTGSGFDASWIGARLYIPSSSIYAPGPPIGSYVTAVASATSMTISANAALGGTIPVMSVIRVHPVTMTTTAGSTAVTLGNGASDNPYLAAWDGYKVVSPNGAGTSIASIAAGTTLTYGSATSGTLSANAATAATFTAWLAKPLPSSASILGSAGAISTAGIPARWFYDATNDPYILPSSVTDLATAAGGTAIQVNGGGHAPATIDTVLSYNSKLYGQDVVDFMIAAETA